MTKKTSPKKPSMAERIRANEAAEAKAKRVARMTSVERLEVITREMAKFAPTLESVESDLLAALQAVGAEFIRRYYPDATTASFSISKYFTGDVSREYRASIPVNIPQAGAPTRPTS